MIKAPVIKSLLHGDEDTVLRDGTTEVDTLASSGTANTAARSPFTLDTAPTVTVADGASFEIGGVSAQSVTFTGTTGTLKIDHALAFTGQVSGLAGSDALDLSDVSYGANTTATFLGNTNGGTLTITDGTHTANIGLQGNYLSSHWNLSSDGNGGTVVVDPVPTNAWQTLKVGAGGFLTGIDIAPDDTMVVRTDTYGAYIWNGTQWQQLVTSTSMPAADAGLFAGTGVYEIRIAPSNTNILYMAVAGNVYRSPDKGSTWTKTAFSQVTEDPNDRYRVNGQKMAVDPNNPNVVYVGTPQNGLFVTRDGGASWQSVSAVPVSAHDTSGQYPGITGIAFDPTSGVTGGNTNTIYASSYGHGVYSSTNGGLSWSALTGGPSDVENAAVSTDGTYYVIGNNDTSVWRYKNGAWTQLLSDTSGNGYHSVAIDPFNPSHIVAVTGGGNINQSLDGGATWSGVAWSNHLSATDIPWLSTTGIYIGASGTLFDRLVPQKLWVSAGAGVWNTSLPQNFTWQSPIVWNSQSVGIEQLVANEIVVPPGGKPVLASWDRSFFYVNDPNTYPSTYGVANQPTFAAGWSVDYASSNPNFLVGIADWWGTEESGYSTNGGQSWTVFPSFPAFAGQATIGGTIAASSPTDIVWAPAGGKSPYYTQDGGVTWKPVILPGVSDWSSFDFVYYLDKRTVTADRVLPNTFYMYYRGTGSTDSGVFRSTDGGSTWTKVFSGSVSPADGFNTRIESVPGNAGNLFFTAGPQGVSSHPAVTGFFQSTDGGATWTAVPNVLEVSTFGFGAPATPGGYPSIYIVGYVNSVYGIWQSNDDARSWSQIGQYPKGSLDQIKTIAGDPNTYGQVYVGFTGSGYAYLPASPLVTPVVTGVVASPSSGIELAGHTASLAATAVNFNGATIVDGAHNLSLTGLTQAGPHIDTSAPSAPLITSEAVSGSIAKVVGANTGTPTAVLSHRDPPTDTLAASPATPNAGGTLRESAGTPTAVFSHIDPPAATLAASLLAAAPNAGGAADGSTALLTQYVAAGFQSGSGSGPGGHTTTPTPETIFGHAPLLTNPAT